MLVMRLRARISSRGLCALFIRCRFWQPSARRASGRAKLGPAMRRRMGLIVSGGIAGVLALAAGARAQVPGVPPPPIPGPTLTSHPPTFLGAPAIPKPIEAPAVPQNPFMAPNGRSNIHDDAYMTDTYEFRGPLGHAIGTASALFFRECASVTFDARGRIVTICVGLDRPELALLDPRTLEPLATFALPPRRPSGNPFSDFSGGGYFYLDNHDRAVIPTSNHRIYVVAERAGRPGFRLVRQYDLRQHMAADDAIISVLPDWSGRLWFATREGEVGTVDPASGAVRAIATGEPIGNSFAVDETGGVFIVSDAALYRFDAGPGGRPSPGASRTRTSARSSPVRPRRGPAQRPRSWGAGTTVSSPSPTTRIRWTSSSTAGPPRSPALAWSARSPSSPLARATPTSR